MRLVCSGVFDQYPNLKIILGHFRGSSPVVAMALGQPLDCGREGGGRRCSARPKETEPIYQGELLYYDQWDVLAPGITMLLFGTRSGSNPVCCRPSLRIKQRRSSIYGYGIHMRCDKEKIYHLNAERLLGL